VPQSEKGHCNRSSGPTAGLQRPRCWIAVAPSLSWRRFSVAAVSAFPSRRAVCSFPQAEQPPAGEQTGVVAPHFAARAEAAEAHAAAVPAAAPAVPHAAAEEALAADRAQDALRAAAEEALAAGTAQDALRAAGEGALAAGTAQDAPWAAAAEALVPDRWAGAAGQADDSAQASPRSAAGRVAPAWVAAVPPDAKAVAEPAELEDARPGWEWGMGAVDWTESAQAAGFARAVASPGGRVRPAGLNAPVPPQHAAQSASPGEL
jgi:hypothetical protein